jgi:tRNA U34 5-methylaminomethyl-2-thiouridine-forming methyltransferase MnmC
MERILLSTADGSHTISIPSLRLTYHSMHGAIQESNHVFIEAGLLPIIAAGTNPLNILEVGFGTGLNAILTLDAAKGISIRYETLEPEPIETNIFNQLNFCDQLGRKDLQAKFLMMHLAKWKNEISIQPGFAFIKHPDTLIEFSSTNKFDLIYFDAFAPGEQPGLWTEEIFTKLFCFLKPEAILVTYCSKSMVRRAMVAAGFKVEKIPGPYGKREIVRARKPAGH